MSTSVVASISYHPMHKSIIPPASSIAFKALVYYITRKYRSSCFVWQLCVEFDDELSWLFTNRFRASRYMKVKRMGITEISRRIWLFSANKIKSSKSVSKQPTQLIVELNSSLWQKLALCTILNTLN